MASSPLSPPVVRQRSFSLPEGDEVVLHRLLSAGHPNGDARETDPLHEGDSADSDASSEPRTPKTPAEKIRVLLGEDGMELDEAIGQLDLDIHALFCQMDVLCHFDDGESGWKEAARWLKYEEKVEAGNRWSKPHVATVSLHALHQVKKALQENPVLLDLDAPHGCVNQVAETENDQTMIHLQNTMERIVEGLTAAKGFDEAKQKAILNTLLRPHKHRHRKGQKKDKKSEHTGGTMETTFTDKRTSTPTKGDSTLDSTKVDDSKTEHKDTSRLVRFKSKVTGPMDKMKRKHDEENEKSALFHSYPGGILPDKLLPYKPNKRLMRKIPGGSEAANILIGQVDFLKEPVVCFARLNKSAVLADLTEVALPTRFIFLVLGPPDTSSIWEYGEIGRAMAALLSDAIFCEVAYKATEATDLIAGVDEYIDDLTVLPPSIWDPTTRLEPPEKTMTAEKIRARLLDSSRHAAVPEAFHFAAGADEQDTSLIRTGRLFGGMWNDMKRRYAFYVSDFTDGFHLQCLASIIFLYFACITPIVTFGGLLGDATGNYMGIMETMLAGSICGIFYALFAGQPLTIVGTTGPMLVFESILYTLCHNQGWDFLTFRFWVGLWVTVMLILIVAFDLSSLVRYITRFTEESFAVLISLIFIAESFKKLAHVWDTHPIHLHATEESEAYKCHCEHPPYTNITETIVNTTADYSPTDHPIFDFLNWTSVVYEDCLTYTHKIIVDSGCITEKVCEDHGWILVGPACNVFTVTHAVPDVFFFCCFLFIGTFVIAIFCSNFRTGLFFPSIVRSTISDFAVLIAILVCTTCDSILRLDTPKLNVPNEFKVRSTLSDFAVLIAILTTTGMDIWLGLGTPKLNVPTEFKIRSTISDFAVMIAIMLCTLLDYLLGIGTPKLLVPTEFKNTNPERAGWLVNPIAFTHWWLILLAILPAALAMILVFLDQQITAVIVNRKEHKLQKGGGYHLDLMVLAILIFVCSLLGLPWFVAATVRAITHVRSLIKESELRAPGERPQFLGVREQRLTALVIHILIGVSVFLTPILRHIPMAVLYGVFLYMGVTSLRGVQFVQRICLLLIPVKYQPDYIYLRHIRTKRVHIFTIVQLICMTIMWVFKSIPAISIAFPLMLLVLCIVRKVMDYVFTKSELYWLDHLLPDETRRKKEDEALEEGFKVIDDKTIAAKLDEDGYFGANLALHGDNNKPEDEWNAIVANRDYQARPRPRRLSQDVISRYKDLHRRSRPPNESDIPETADDEERTRRPSRTLLQPEPFRQRKFSY